MKVSIITVCYNSESTILETIHSVLSQTYPNIEYIIVDGNSRDKTVDIIKAFNSEISKWISETDNGLYDAMNKGISLATGDIIGILNSDDTFYSEKTIEQIVDFHMEHKIDASVGNIIQWDNMKNVKRKYSSINWNPVKLKIGFMPPHPSIFLKKELFTTYGFYSNEFKIAADYELITRFFFKNNINWMYSDIITTSMLTGGLSSPGFFAYFNISKEIFKALKMNNVEFNKIVISFRFVWKIISLNG
jgi:glycosyltransferase involved in cell wall biosynthesis